MAKDTELLSGGVKFNVGAVTDGNYHQTGEDGKNKMYQGGALVKTLPDDILQVDNTSDLNKPVSTATQSAIDALDKTSVGLDNVDNTSDADKPVSEATQTALDGKLNVGDNHLETIVRTGNIVTGTYTQNNIDGTQEAFVNHISKGIVSPEGKSQTSTEVLVGSNGSYFDTIETIEFWDGSGFGGATWKKTGNTDLGKVSTYPLSNNGLLYNADGVEFEQVIESGIYDGSKFGLKLDGTVETVDLQSFSDLIPVDGTLFLPTGKTIVTEDTITIKSTNHINILAVLQYNEDTVKVDNLDRPVIIHGEQAVIMRDKNIFVHKIRYSSINWHASWDDTNFMGIRIINSRFSNITIQNIEGFHTAIDCVGWEDGFVSNEVHLGGLGYNNIDLRWLADGVGGYCNDNLFYGGWMVTRFDVDFETQTRYGVVAELVNGAVDPIDKNTWIKPIFEKRAGSGDSSLFDFIPILIKNGIGNKFLNARLEGQFATPQKAMKIIKGSNNKLYTDLVIRRLSWAYDLLDVSGQDFTEAIDNGGNEVIENVLGKTQHTIFSGSFYDSIYESDPSSNKYMFKNELCFYEPSRDVLQNERAITSKNHNSRDITIGASEQIGVLVKMNGTQHIDVSVSCDISKSRFIAFTFYDENMNLLISPTIGVASDNGVVGQGTSVSSPTFLDFGFGDTTPPSGQVGRISSGKYTISGDPHYAFIALRSDNTSIDISSMKITCDKGFNVPELQNFFTQKDGSTKLYSNTTTPTNGSFIKGDRLRYADADSSTDVVEAVVTKTGTYGTLVGVTGSLTSGTRLLTVNDASDLFVGAHIIGVALAAVREIVSIDGNVVTLHADVGVTLTDDPISFSAPVLTSTIFIP